MNEQAPFALFTGATYYPPPGWQGHSGQFKSLEEACAEGKRIAESDGMNWWQVVDLRELKIVAGEGAGYAGLWGKVAACPA